MTAIVRARLGRKRRCSETISRVCLICRPLARSNKKSPAMEGTGQRWCRAGNLQKQFRDGSTQIVLRQASVCISRNSLSIGLRGSERPALRFLRPVR